jgi:hypothetical protein
MKKRLFIGLVVGTMCVGLVGCGGNSSNTGSGSSESVSTETESDTETDTETEEASSEEITEKKGLSSVDISILTEKLPDMVSAFKSDVEAIIVGDDHVYYNVDPVTFDEVDAYISSCKNAGYTYNTDQGSDDTGCNYWAYDETGTYYLEINYSSVSNDVDIYLTDKSKQ